MQKAAIKTRREGPAQMLVGRDLSVIEQSGPLSTEI
jgi:hypothetical protein